MAAQVAQRLRCLPRPGPSRRMPHLHTSRAAPESQACDRSGVVFNGNCRGSGLLGQPRFRIDLRRCEILLCKYWEVLEVYCDWMSRPRPKGRRSSGGLCPELALLCPRRTPPSLSGGLRGSCFERVLHLVLPAGIKDVASSARVRNGMQGTK